MESFRATIVAALTRRRRISAKSWPLLETSCRPAGHSAMANCCRSIPAGTTANMILRGANTSPSAGQYEIYNISNNAILTSYSLGQVGTNWQFVGLGGFYGSDTSDMLLLNSTGGFEVYDISNNNITNAAFLGAVGMNWQVMGFGNFSSFGETDMIMRSANTGGVEVYDISNNQITGANFMGTVGLDWQVGGFGNFSSRGTSDICGTSIPAGWRSTTSIAIKSPAPPSWERSGWIGRSSASVISAACRAKPT